MPIFSFLLILFRSFAYFDWTSSPGWPFPTLKYKYIRKRKQLYRTSPRNCYGLNFKNTFVVLFIIIFGTLPFPTDHIFIDVEYAGEKKTLNVALKTWKNDNG